MTSRSDHTPSGRRETLIPHTQSLDPRVPLAKLDGSSIYRRRIRLMAESGSASAELEDDFHHFVARIEHDGERVTRVTGEAVRFPWTTCPGAVLPLAVLEGTVLTRDLQRLSAEVDLKSQSTHLFDAATLAIALVASGRSHCVYDAEVPEPRDGVMSVRLSRDGKSLLEWRLKSFTVQTAGPLEGCLLVGSAFSEAVQSLADPGAIEPVLVLRRAVLISMARTFDMDQVSNPRAFAEAIGARCHTFSEEHASHAKRIVGANRDFSDGPDGLLRDP